MTTLLVDVVTPFALLDEPEVSVQPGQSMPSNRPAVTLSSCGSVSEFAASAPFTRNGTATIPITIIFMSLPLPPLRSSYAIASELGAASPVAVDCQRRMHIRSRPRSEKNHLHHRAATEQKSYVSVVKSTKPVHQNERAHVRPCQRGSERCSAYCPFG